MKIPENLHYSAEHLWTQPAENGVWKAGITDYAQDLLGDIVFVDAPAVGTVLVAGQPCGLVESVKTGSDLHALVDGEVTEINSELANSPEKINDNPYQTWIFKYKPSNPDVSQQLLSAADYRAITENN